MSTNYIVTDDNGLPIGAVDLDELQALALRFGYDLADNSGDESALERISAEYLKEAGTEGFGYLTAAALRMVVANILEPVLQVLDALHENGHLAHDIRAGITEASLNARATLGGDRD